MVPPLAEFNKSVGLRLHQLTEQHVAHCWIIEVFNALRAFAGNACIPLLIET